VDKTAANCFNYIPSFIQCQAKNVGNWKGGPGFRLPNALIVGLTAPAIAPECKGVAGLPLDSP